MEFKECIDKAIHLIKEFDVSVIYLFGSASRNELRRDSDIDIAFLSNKEIDEYLCFMKAQDIAEIFNKDVDLVDLIKASTVFAAQIIGSGRVIYCNDSIKRANFEIRTLKEYALLNEERKAILENIKESGCVYGKRRNL